MRKKQEPAVHLDNTCDAVDTSFIIEIETAILQKLQNCELSNKTFKE